MKQLIGRASVVTLGSCALVLATALPASAHSVSEAIRYGCGSGYSLVSDGTRNVGSWGQVHLTYNSSNGYNCVVTRKTGAYHGVASRVTANLEIQGRGDYWKSDDNASHWEAVKAYGRGACVKYWAAIWNPAGSRFESGGRLTWGNCG